MTSAEITAYLAGIELGRGADVITLMPNGIPVDPTARPPHSLYEAWRKLGTDRLRYWMLRGVGDAHSDGHALP